MYINIHTHNPESPNQDHLSIYNLQITQPLPMGYIGKYSAGIHPWNIPSDHSQAIATLKQMATESNIVAIGECGLDKLCQTPFGLQTKIFEEHIKISEEVKKPLIIHCVKSYNQIVELKKEYKPTQPWIMHGFRGKPQTATMLINTGIILSIGEKYNPDTVKALPIEKILIESDESSLSIEDIYQNIAQTRGISVEELKKEVENTHKSIFKQNIRTII